MSAELDFDTQYRRDTTTGAYEVEVALRAYGDVFSSWDPAPFKRRSLDPDLEAFLEDSVIEIPAGQAIQVGFAVAGARDAAREAELRAGLANAYAFKRRLVRREMGRTLRRVAVLAIAGLVALAVGTAIWTGGEGRAIIPLLGEALYIGGWVFIWEAVSLVVFTERELYDRYRMLRRIQAAPIVFHDAATTAGTTSGDPHVAAGEPDQADRGEEHGRDGE
jgi:hypothetical protein